MEAMATTTETANPEMIALAREYRCLAQSELAPKVGMSQVRLSRIEAGMYPATPDDIRRLSRELRFPESFFFQTERRYGLGVSEFYHRKRAKLTARSLDAIHARIEVIRLHISRLLKSADLRPSVDDLPRIDLEGTEQSPEDAARVIRSVFMLPRGPVDSVIHCLEDAGGIVVRVDFGTRLLDAVSRWIPGMPPLFVANRSMPSDRERFTLAHELGHLVLHKTPHPDMEDEAHQFASEFLMPAADIKASLHDITLPKHAALKAYWKVSMAALIRKAFDLDTIDERRYRSLNIQLSKAGYKTREPMEPPREPTSLMEGLIEFHMRDLSFAVDELATYLHVGVDDLLATYQIDAPFHSGSSRHRLRAVRDF
jgi:Zn-dependent peptidase ImmA (M78 family)